MKSFDILKKDFINIKNKGYIKSVNSYRNGAGLTLEKELGSTGGDFNVPDYLDIEIKTVYKYRRSDIELFNSAPDGIHFPGAIWLAENYGYPDKEYRNFKVFKGTVYGNAKTNIGYKYQFKLNICKEKRKIILEIYNGEKLINNEIFWYFDSLKEKLERKDKKMAVFTFTKHKHENENYYKYEKLYMYSLKNFETFVDLIEKGIIFVIFKVGVHKSGKYIGKLTDHGTAFKIYFGNMHKLFNKHF